MKQRLRKQAGKLARKHPKATTQVFDNAGHALFWDEAAAFNAAVEAFVPGLPAGR